MCFSAVFISQDIVTDDNGYAYLDALFTFHLSNKYLLVLLIRLFKHTILFLHWMLCETLQYFFSTHCCRSLPTKIVWIQIFTWQNYLKAIGNHCPKKKFNEKDCANKQRSIQVHVWCLFFSIVFLLKRCDIFI